MVSLWLENSSFKIQFKPLWERFLPICLFYPKYCELLMSKDCILPIFLSQAPTIILGMYLNPGKPLVHIFELFIQHFMWSLFLILMVLQRQKPCWSL